MTWAVLGAALITTVGSIGGQAASGGFKGQAGPPPQPGMIPEKPPAPPYKPTAEGAATVAPALPPPIPTAAPGAGALPPMLPPAMNLEELKKMYGMM